MVRKDFEWNPRKAYLMFSSPTSGTSIQGALIND